MRNVLFFDNMLTPKIIVVIYWLGILGTIGAGIAQMFTGYDGFSSLNFIKGLGVILIGILLLRIWCELFVVMFKINEALQVIRHK